MVAYQISNQLQGAILSDNSETVKEQLTIGADIFTQDEMGNSALHLAVVFGAKQSIIEMLLKHAAKLDSIEIAVNAQNNHDQTPLHLGIIYRQVHALKVLLTPVKGRCFIHVKHGDLSCCLKEQPSPDLFKFQIQWDLRDENNHTAIDYAQMAFNAYYDRKLDQANNLKVQAIVKLLDDRGLFKQIPVKNTLSLDGRLF